MSDGRPLLVILRALKLGDYLTGLPALWALREAFPEHRSVLLCQGWLRELADHVGATDDFVAHPGLVPLPGSLFGADIAVDLHGSGPGSQPLLLASRPRRLIAFAHPDVPGTESGPSWRRDEHEVLRWCRLLAEAGVLADPSRLRIPVPDLEIPGHLRGATVLHPGAASPARCWPLDRFAAVGRELSRRGHALAVTAGPGEEQLARSLAGLLSLADSRVIIGSSLLRLAAILGAARRLISGDTGVAHLATALDVPSVVLFGPVSPARWGPPPGSRRQVPLWAGREGDPHGRVVDPGLLEISVAEVISALDQLDHHAAPGTRNLSCLARGAGAPGRAAALALDDGAP